MACFSSPNPDHQLPSFHQQSTTTSPQKNHIQPTVFAKTPAKTGSHHPKKKLRKPWSNPLTGSAYHMELRHLRYFTVVVQWKGYREASRHLYITQPSISEAVSDLETELGIKLFSLPVNGQPAPYPSLAVRARNGRVADNSGAILAWQSESTPNCLTRSLRAA